MQFQIVKSRRELGLSPRVLARLLEVSESSYLAFEHRKQCLYPPKLVTLGEVLGDVRLVLRFAVKEFEESIVAWLGESKDASREANQLRRLI